MSIATKAEAGWFAPTDGDLLVIRSSTLVPGGWFGILPGVEASAAISPLSDLAAFDGAWAAFDRLEAEGPAGFPAADGASVPAATAMGVGGPTLVPYGWFDFCSRRPEECKVKPLPPQEVQLTTDAWALLDRVNRTANGAIRPVSNLDHWGTTLDHWDYPTDGSGDCKVYALYKRKLLLEAGLPRQALLITIVRDLAGDGHTILTVRTDHGDFVLDNLAADIRPWDATGYTYLKRQAQNDPNVWLNLHGVRGIRAETVASAVDFVAARP
ncbi:MAG: transglutaminase-like cysteine peptidase [Ancalomicrobiaceae bacterium]|nr:transglutaminase-like cysteine peptidase [Ancalomicrobiaceae bacterium]